jgi:SAM-dependent methyltransferase
LLYRSKDYRLRIDDVLWNVVQCTACGLGYLNPRPTSEEIGRYYPQSYYAHRVAATERYQRQARYLTSATPGRLLDVGTARGDFLRVMRGRGWEVTGIEPFGTTDVVTDLLIHRIPFPEGYRNIDGGFDVITAWAVFEHLHHPAAAFSACCELLRPGGQLVVQVPNLRSIASRWGRQEDIPRHLYFFDERTLGEYAQRSGLALDAVVHTTDLFGGSGRGVMRLGLMRACGRSVDDYFDLYSASRRDRFRRWPVMATACTAVGLMEKVILSDWLVRRMRISGQVVAYFRSYG